VKVYVGKFRYIYDGDTDVVVATTKERIEKELTIMAERYVAYLDEEDKNDLLNDDNSFDAWQQVGWNNEWFDLQWVQTEILSDEHILKHAMETI
jgi:hypothetical protein